jgi:hypothetical protein
VVRHLVQDDMPDLPVQQLAVIAVQALQRPAVDGDLVRQRADVPAGAPGERNPLV